MAKNVVKPIAVVVVRILKVILRKKVNVAKGQKFSTSELWKILINIINTTLV